MGEMEAVGDAAMGGLAAHAVEPATGLADGHSQEKNCLNCGCRLVGSYCHCCGQQAHLHRTLRAFGHDLLHGALHFEGKIWHTLPLLVWQPGDLTRRYIDGERAKFVSPIALFLFIVFLMFAIMSVTGSLETKSANPGAAIAEGVAEARELSEARERVAALESEQGRAGRERRPAQDIDQSLADARAKLEKLAPGTAGGNAAPPVPSSGEAPAWVQGFVDKTSANPELLFYKLKTNAYKFSWALIPISVPFVWLLFPFSRRFRLYDHTVFITYSLCFMMLLLIVGSLVELGWPTLASLLFFVPPFHMYRQLKGSYSLGRAGALWRTALLVGFAFAAIGMFVALIVGAGEV